METKKEKKFRVEGLLGTYEITGFKIQTYTGTNGIQIIDSNDEIVAVIPPGMLIFEIK